VPEGTLVAVLFGWPALVLGIVLAVCGACLKRAVLPLLGAIVVLPVAWYLSGTPRFGGFAWLLPVLLAASALSIYRRWRGVTWSLLAVAAGFVALLVCIVVR